MWALPVLSPYIVGVKALVDPRGRNTVVLRFSPENGPFASATNCPIARGKIEYGKVRRLGHGGARRTGRSEVGGARP